MKEIRELRRVILPEPPPSRDFTVGTSTEFGLIAEIKNKSPSSGWLSQVMSVEDRAYTYESGGAHAISVLCDEYFFSGSYKHLRRADAVLIGSALMKQDNPFLLLSEMSAVTKKIELA